MKFNELLNIVKDEEWSMQLINNCITGIQQKKNPAPHSTVTFVTEEITPNDVMSNKGKVGVVVWIDRDAFNREVNNAQ